MKLHTHFAFSIAVSMVLSTLGIVCANAEVQNASSQNTPHQREGNTSIYLLEARYFRSAADLPRSITACDLFDGASSKVDVPCYAVVYLQHFHGQDHNGSIVGGIKLPQIGDKGSERSPSIKLQYFPEVLAAITPSLPKDFKPSMVDMVFYEIITLDEKLVPEEVSLIITAGFEDERHEFKFQAKHANFDGSKVNEVESIQKAPARPTAASELDAK